MRGSEQNVRKYYFAGSSRIAMLAPLGCSASLRKNGTLTWLLSDHLGSTSMTADASGNMLSSLRYSAFGELRAATGVTGTAYRFTGQRSETEIGLYYYVARFYDPSIMQFNQPDSLIPDPYNPLAYDRYSYAYNNPIRYRDSSGHCIDGITTAVCILAGGMIVGAITGYAVQVADNRANGMEWGEALTTNISSEKIAAGAVIGGGIVVGAVVAGTVTTAGAAALGLSGAAACADGDCTNEIQTATNAGKALVDIASKSEARNLIRTGINGLSNGQTQKALDILRSGRLDNMSITALENNTVQIVAQRSGVEGFQRLIYTIDPSGKTISLIQQAFNAAGELVHVHDKLKNAIIK